LKAKALGDFILQFFAEFEKKLWHNVASHSKY